MTDKATSLIVRGGNGEKPKLVKESISKPKPSARQILVKVSHVAQNPTDVQSFDRNAFGDGAVLGCDFVGTVEETGSEVTRAKKGDVIAGLIWGGEIKGVGGYAEYTLADNNVQFIVPKSIQLDAAATVPLAATTAWLALFSKDCLNIDRNEAKNESIVIWGGSSSVGLYAIQIAAIYGLNVVATCSPSNFDLVKSMGAKHVFNYRDSDVVSKIQSAAPNLKYIFDTIGNEKSSATASQAIDQNGGTLCTVRPGKANTKNVTKQTNVTDVLVWTAFPKEHRYGDFHWPLNEGDVQLSSQFYDKLPGWLEKGKIKPNETKVLQGLDSVPTGFQEYRDGNISAYKIVYKL